MDFDGLGVNGDTHAGIILRNVAQVVRSLPPPNLAHDGGKTVVGIPQYLSPVPEPNRPHCHTAAVPAPGGLP